MRISVGRVLTLVRWCSATALSLRPAVLMQMKLTDGTTQQFEMNIFRFHQLRYYVAKTLKDMQDIEQLAILKID